MSKGLCRCIAFVLALIGVYFIIWGIANTQFDEYFAVGIILCLISALLFYLGFRKSSTPEPVPHSFLPCTNHPEHDSTERCEICGKPFCDDCLSKIYNRYYCDKCKESFLQKISQIPLKSRTVALLLCLFFGQLGVHRIYLGNNSGAIFLILHAFFIPASALLYIPIIIYVPIIVVLGAIVLVDLINLAVGNTTDAYGRDLA